MLLKQHLWMEEALGKLNGKLHLKITFTPTKINHINESVFSFNNNIIDIYIPEGSNGAVFFNCVSGELVNISRIEGELLKLLIEVEFSLTNMMEKLNIDYQDAQLLIDNLITKNIISKI